MRKIGYILCVILGISFLAFASETSAYAKGNDNKKEEHSIDNVILGFLQACEFDINEKYFMSQPYSINGDLASNLYFVFDSYGCIGQLITRNEFDGGTFYQEKCDYITNIYKEQRRISVNADNKGVYLIGSMGFIKLYGENNDYPPLIVSSELYSIELTEISAANRNGQNIMSAGTQSRYLSVPFVQNADSPDTGIGLCWLASSISMIRYFDSSFSYSLMGLYNHLKTLYPPYMYDYPEGSTDFIRRAFWVDYLTIDCINRGLSFAEVKAIIDEDKPIMAVIKSTDALSVHAVVICGYSRSTQAGMTYYSYYRFMDPNVSNYVTISASNNSGEFVYSNGGHDYVYWTRSYYY